MHSLRRLSHLLTVDQTEFYFNNANLPTDEHMWNLTGGPENKPVELKHLHTFGRMRRFPNYTALVAALKDSDVLDISGEEGSEVVKRKVPYELRSNKGDILKASVYVKGFGDEDAMTQFNLERFFKQFGGVNAVRLRRTEENLFKGSVFVEFASEDEAKSFLALDPAPKWEGHDLKIMSKQAYVEDKSRAIKAGEIQPSNSREKKFFEGRGGKGDKNRSGGRGGFRGDKNDWKNRRDHDQKNGFRDNRGGRGRGRGRGGRGGRGGRDRNDRDDRSNRRDEKPVDPRDAYVTPLNPSRGLPLICQQCPAYDQDHRRQRQARGCRERQRQARQGRRRQRRRAPGEEGGRQGGVGSTRDRKILERFGLMQSRYHTNQGGRGVLWMGPPMHDMSPAFTRLAFRLRRYSFGSRISAPARGLLRARNEQIQHLFAAAHGLVLMTCLLSRTGPYVETMAGETSRRRGLFDNSAREALQGCSGSSCWHRPQESPARARLTLLDHGRRWPQVSWP